MSLKKELDTLVHTIFKERWTSRDGTVVPEASSLKLNNDAVKLDATVLYADIADSTKLVDTRSPEVAAEVYKAYLACAAKIIKNNEGVITAYDGDRVMAVFIGGSKNTNAAKTALKINWAVYNIINPKLKAQYGDDTYQMKHVIGIDTSQLLVARIGVRLDNDLVWVGRSANHTAKLASINGDFTIYITPEVFNKLADSSKYGGNENRLMWEKRTWKWNSTDIYCSNWTTRID